jgi:hypothetical protein
VIFSVAVEGRTDFEVSKRILAHTGHAIDRSFIQTGKDRLDAQLAGYNNAARYRQPWFVLRDLDHDAVCAPSLVGAKLPNRSPLMFFRLAVRALEAWLIADSEGMAAFLGVSVANFPDNPDRLDDPKAVVLRAASKSARKAAMLPEPGVRARVGPAYVPELISFIVNHWSIDRAAEQSDSLRRCVEALRAL